MVAATGLDQGQPAHLAGAQPQHLMQALVAMRIDLPVVQPAA